MENKPRIRVGRTEMDFPHQGKVLTAVHPFYGSANSLNLQKQIREAGLVEPTAPEVVSFVHEYFDGKELQAQDVTNVMKNNYFRAFTGILYDPETKLVSFAQRPVFNAESVIDRVNLLQRADFQAQVPFDCVREGQIPWREVAKHPYLVAWAGGKEGAEKLAELASKHPAKAAYLWVPNISNLEEPIARTGALYSSWDGGLGVGGYYDGNESSYAFGVKPSA